MTTHQKLIKAKLNLLDLASYLGNVSEACRALGYSRDTFYRVTKRYEEAGLDGLQELSRKKPNLKNRVAEEVEQAVVELALEFPAYGQVRVANRLLETKGHSISPTGIRSIWQRHGLETKKKRLKALEEKVAQEGYVLTESQIQALEAAQAEKEAFGSAGASCVIGRVDGCGRDRSRSAATHSAGATPVARQGHTSLTSCGRIRPPSSGLSPIGSWRTTSTEPPPSAPAHSIDELRLRVPPSVTDAPSILVHPCLVHTQG